MERMVRTLAIAWCLVGCATTVHGVVFSDLNHDGKRQRNEPAVPGAVVMLDRGPSIRTDASGRYDFLAPDDQGVVWVRVPDGFRPGAVWRHADGGMADLPLVPLTADELASPLTFVVAADTHTTTSQGNWDGGDLDDALSQALGLATPPRFFTIVGDVTQSNADAEFTRVETTLASFPIPWIPVPGNHDWYDGGVAWRKRWGPDNYSFDVGDLHVVVWDTNLPEEDQIAFFERELADLEPAADGSDRVIVALGHGSPSDLVADRLSDLGVDYLFTGHWHSNRRVERHGLVEWGTQTLVMGTIDQSPSGYRIVTFVDGVPTVEHRARLVSPELAVTAPAAASCASPAGFELLVSAALDAALPAVTARVDCGSEIPLAPRGDGGWSFGATVGPLAVGTHSLDVVATSPSGRRVAKQLAISVCSAPQTPHTAADWPQLGGSETHGGATARQIPPPLVQQWATSVGGNVLLGTPVVRGDTVVVAVWDLGGGDRGGLVALDLTTGEVRWRYTTAFPVHAAPAIGARAIPASGDAAATTEDVVVVALENGEVHAVDLATGAPRWQRDIADGLDSLASSLWAAPTISAGVVYAAVQGRMSALSLTDGAPVWVRDRTPDYPWLGTLASVTVSDGLAIANYARDEGMTAWTATAGDKRWELRDSRTIAINSTPVVANGRVFYIDSSGQITAAALATSTTLWSRRLVADSNDWSYAITATPAFADGRLFVPTQYGDLLAIDADTGEDLWRHRTAGGPLNFAHYRASQPGFPASPVVTGNLVWIPHPDGRLVAAAADDGHELWSTSLGAPLVSAPAPAGDYLIVATFDGTVRALVPGQPVVPQPVATCNDATDPPAPELITASGSGCCSGTGDPVSTALLILIVAFPGLRRRYLVTPFGRSSQ